MTGRTFDYAVYGLVVRSELELPELVPLDKPGKPDIEVRLRTIAGPFEPGIHAWGSGTLLGIADVARYGVRGGTEIHVDPVEEASPTNVRLFLLGSAMGLLIHQRGMLPLHANAVEVGSSAVAFMGHSGAGKSTLAAWFHDQGHRIVADDVCVVGFTDDGRPLANPGIPRLRLWRDALEFSGRDTADHAPSFDGAIGRDKFDLPVLRQQLVDAPLALSAIYLLQTGERFRIERLTGIAAAEAIFSNTYRGGYVPLTDNSSPHWSACVRLVRSTPVFLAERAWGLAELATQNQLLKDHATGAL